MKKLLFVAALALCLYGCKKDGPEDYGYLLVSNQLNEDIRAHAEDPYKKSTYTYDFIFPAHTETVWRMYVGGYALYEYREGKEHSDCLVIIHSMDTTVNVYKYPQ